MVQNRGQSRYPPPFSESSLGQQSNSNEEEESYGMPPTDNLRNRLIAALMDDEAYPRENNPLS